MDTTMDTTQAASTASGLFATYYNELTYWLGHNSMTWLDWAIIIVYCLFSLAVGLYFTRRASKSMDEYFVSGRSMSWWLLGSSMIATSFASDTPLVVASYIRKQGIWGNWWWLCFAIAQLLAVFSFSLFWRRAEVMTDNQLIEMRYSGRPAAFLRGFKAALGATLYNFIVLGWVLTAIGTVSEVVLGVPMIPAIVIFSLITLIYCTAGGIYAAVWTDLVQLVIMMGGMVVLACYAVAAVGGLDELRAAVASRPQMAFMPSTAGGLHLGSPLFDFLTFILVSWWASQNADGGGYIIQRMAAAKTERDSRLAVLWFVVGTYALRLWPWVIIAAVSLILYPQIGDPRFGKLHDQAAFPMVMKDVLHHPGLLGLMMAAFIAAFMSTVSTHLNWGASYLINDIYRRFLVRQATERHYVLVSYVANVVILAVAGVVAVNITAIEGAWEFVRALGAGVGAILILRWFWWRINAWTEIAALGVSLAVVAVFEILAYQQNSHAEGGYNLFATPLAAWGLTWTFANKMFVIVPLSLTAGFIATLVTAPTDRARLVSFYRKVRPGGAWGNIPREAGVRPAGLSWKAIGGWLASIAFIYTLTFGMGKLIFGPTWLGWLLLGIAAVSGWATWIAMKEEPEKGAQAAPAGEKGPKRELEAVGTGADEQ